jgi:DNA-binding MarR family transcriptional regulator
MRPKEPIGLLIGAVRRRIRQLAGGLAGEHHLSPQQLFTIVAIAKNRGISLRELAEQRRMDYPTASRVVEALVRRRIVRSQTDPSDRRRSLLALTRSGETLARQLVPIATGIVETVESALHPAEREALVRGLQKILLHLDRHAASQSRRLGPERRTTR